jgi:DnaJ family protein C protein 7
MNSTGLNEKRTCEMLLKQIERAEGYIAAGKFRMAASLTATAMETAPASVQLQTLQAESLLGMGSYDECYAQVTSLMRRDPSNIDLMLLRGRALYHQGNTAQALTHFAKVLRSDPDHAKCKVEFRRVKALEKTKAAGNEHFKNRKWADAVQSYSECLDVDPQAKKYNAKVFCNRAAALTHLARFDEAIVDCDRAIKADPHYAKAYLRRANCGEQIGTPESIGEAIRDFERAQKICGDQDRTIERQIRAAKLALKKANRKDYYKLLGVSPHATEAEIKKGYRKSALKYHPDRHASKSEAEQAKAEACFKDVATGYELLSDPQKRAAYDQGQDAQEIESGGGHHHGGGGMGGMDPSDLFR